LTESKQFKDILQAVLDFDADRLQKTVEARLAEGVDPVVIIEQGLSPALQVVGEKFESGEFFLLDLMAAAECVQKVMTSQIEPRLKSSGTARKSLGKIVIGTVKDDIHDIGKSIVRSMLFSAGFEVFDLGKDVPTLAFIDKMKAVKADIVAASALLTTTMPMQREIVRSVVEAGMRDRVKLLFGGAPVNENWVREIGGDAYGGNAVAAVKIAKSFLKAE
jgi:corrinoid protein of di/trimethylamine methyltransferase